jgi:hypothetical protein
MLIMKLIISRYVVQHDCDMEKADLYRNIGRKYSVRPILQLLIALHTYTCSDGKATNVSDTSALSHLPREGRHLRKTSAAATPVLTVQLLHVFPGAFTNVC